MVKHIVLLKMKAGTSEAAIAHVRDSIAALRKKIPGVVDFLWGPYDSPEGFNQGFTHGFIMTFESRAARDAYLPHPEHKPVVDLVLASTDDVIAFDFAV